MLQTHLARVLLAAPLIALAPQAAFAFTPSGDCSGWTAPGYWSGPAYTVADATLERLVDGVYQPVDLSSTDHVSTAAGPFEISGSWTSQPATGSYRIRLVIALYGGFDHVPSEAELAAYPAEFIYRSNEVSIGFECVGPPPSGCTRTPGFWKTHPCQWGADALTIGDSIYDRACLWGVLRTSPRGDVRYPLLHHLIAAKLNITPSPYPQSGDTDPNAITGYPNARSTIRDTIAAADAYLRATGTRIRCRQHDLTGSNPRGASRDQANAIKDALEDYNQSGRCCRR